MSRDLTPIYDVMPQQANQPAVVETTSQPTPNVAVAPVAPSATNMVAPPNGGPLPPGLSLPSLGNVTPGQMPALPTMPTTGELAKKVTDAQKESGPPVAPSALDQLDLKKHMHDFIESEHFWPTVGTGALALAGYGGAKAYQAYKKSKSVQERDISKIEPSFMGGGTETMTAAAEREMRDPIVKNGIRESELKSFLNTDRLPTGMDLDLAVKSYLGTMGKNTIPPSVDLGSGMNFRPGEPVMGSVQATPDNVTGVDYSKPAYLRNKRTVPETTPVLNPVVEATALNIPTFGEPKNAEQGGVEIPANSDPVHVKEEQDLSAAAQNPQERAQTIDTAKTEVKDAIRPIDTSRNIFDETLPSSIEPKIKELGVKPLTTGSGMPAFQGTAPEGTKFKKNLQGEKKIQTFEGLHEIPSTHAFVPNGQYMDILRNAIGQEAFTSGLQKAGGYPETPQKAYELSRAINESQSRLPRDIAKDLNIGLGETTKAITQKMPGGAKSASMKGPLAGIGAVILMSDLANAETPAERKAILRDAAEGLLPLGVNPTEAGAPGLTPAIREAQRQATLLGSPYRKSEDNKKSKR